MGVFRNDFAAVDVREDYATIADRKSKFERDGKAKSYSKRTINPK